MLEVIEEGHKAARDLQLKSEYCGGGSQCKSISTDVEWFMPFIILSMIAVFFMKIVSQSMTERVEASIKPAATAKSGKESV